MRTTGIGEALGGSNPFPFPFEKLMESPQNWFAGAGEEVLLYT